MNHTETILNGIKQAIQDGKATDINLREASSLVLAAMLFLTPPLLRYAMPTRSA